MQTIFKSPRRTLLLGLLLVVPLLALAEPAAWDSAAFWSLLLRWLHVGAGVLLVGLLWYVNLLLVPGMPRLSAEARPAVAGVIGPTVLLWMRWAGLATAASGLLLAWLQGYLATALSLGLFGAPAVAGQLAIGLGMWVALFMIANLWLWIWPQQRIALGEAAEPERRAVAAGRALRGSRLNLALSLPMLFLMVAAQNL